MVFHSSERQYEVFDIYNNGFSLGGKLKVSFDRYLIVNQNRAARLTESLTYPKIVHRKSLDDIVLKVGMSVSIRSIRSYEIEVDDDIIIRRTKYPIGEGRKQ